MEDFEDIETNQTHFKLQAPHSTSLKDTKFIVITMGCTHNQGDSDAIASQFLLHGATLTGYDEANLVYVNSCTVKTPSQDKALNQTIKGLEAGKTVVLGGCVPQSFKVDARLQKYLQTNQLLLTGVLDDQILQKLIESLGNKQAPSEKLIINQNQANHNPSETPAYRRFAVADIITICTGCLGCCTYCKTVQSRGRLRSQPIELILKRVQSALENEQIRELWFTGEDTLAWGQEQNKSFKELFDAIFAVIEQHKSHKMIRIGMTDPESIINHVEHLVQVLRHKNVYKFLHLPVQSASDAVLQKMRRRYTYQQYKDAVEYLQKEVPDLVIATDIIVGFPGESEEDHAQTLQYLSELQPQIVNVTQYYVRDGTPAASYVQVDNAIKKRRSQEAAAAAVQHFNRQQYVGRVFEVIVTEKLSFKDGFQHKRVFGAKSINYLSVLLEFDYHDGLTEQQILEQVPCRLGDTVKVEITGTTRVALVGKLVV